MAKILPRAGKINVIQKTIRNVTTPNQELAIIYDVFRNSCRTSGFLFPASEPKVLK